MQSPPIDFIQIVWGSIENWQCDSRKFHPTFALSIQGPSSEAVRPALSQARSSHVRGRPPPAGGPSRPRPVLRVGSKPPPRRATATDPARCDRRPWWRGVAVAIWREVLLPRSRVPAPGGRPPSLSGRTSRHGRHRRATSALVTESSGADRFGEPAAPPPAGLRGRENGKVHPPGGRRCGEGPGSATASARRASPLLPVIVGKTATSSGFRRNIIGVFAQHRRAPEEGALGNIFT
jgi:hypothetical protein